jgi:hypothetical protein
LNALACLDAMSQCHHVRETWHWEGRCDGKPMTTAK